MRRAHMRNGTSGVTGHGARGTAIRLRAALAATGLAWLLAGCAGAGTGGGNGNVGPMGVGGTDGQGLFGSQMQTTTVASSGTTTSTNLSPDDPVIRGSVSPTPKTTDNPDYSCPLVQVRGGAGSWQVTEPARGEEPAGVRYQATLGQFARECRYTSPDMTMRVGIQGRVLLGAKGGPGKINVPIRLALLQEGPEPKSIWTKLYSVPVEIGPNVLQVDFGLVADDVTFPRPDAATLDKYVVYVGFDPQGATAADKPAARPRTSRPKPVQSAPAPSAPAQTSRPTTAPSAPSTPVVQQAPIEAPAAPVTEAPATPAAPAAPQAASGSGQNQWIGAPAPATNTFSQ